MPSTFWISLFAGFVLLTLEAVALLQNRTFAASKSRGTVWLRIYRWRYLFGLVLAVASISLWYPSLVNGERFKVVGLPFVIVLFDQAGKDYVGTLTFPSLLADIIVWLLIPDLLLWLWARRVCKSPATA